jgi:plastocyanin
VPLPGTPAAPPAASTSGASTTPSGKSSGGSADRVGTVSGRVESRGGELKDAYVYVDVAKGSSARGHTLEIKQKDKQFWPQTAVVQRGTSVTFPNMDAVFHNVFSTSGRNSFDLGSYRSGDPARSVVLTTPGVVEVFCNIHSKMNANILVVPGPLYAKVGGDGSYRIENVPVGSRRIVAWSPNAKPVQQKIEVGSSGGQANFTLEMEATKAHLNKLGQPYGSYKD